MRLLVAVAVALAALVGAAFGATRRPRDPGRPQPRRHQDRPQHPGGRQAALRRGFDHARAVDPILHPELEAIPARRALLTFEGKPCAKGVALIVTVTGRAAWRTAVGLRVGDPVARVRALYPRARPRTGFGGDNGYWLVTREICAEVGGGSYPGLLARMQRGRVSALVASISICD